MECVVCMLTFPGVVFSGLIQMAAGCVCEAWTSTAELIHVLTSPLVTLKLHNWLIPACHEFLHLLPNSQNHRC